MNNKEHSIAQIESFLLSDEKCMLLTGTHQYEKHKLVMRMLNKYEEKLLVLFRTNAMQNLNCNEFLGWAGVKKKPKSGERLKIGSNIYECDSLNTPSTWSRTSNKFACALVYPIDPLCRSKDLAAIDDLFRKEISKIFLISWTDCKDNDYSIFSEYVSRHVVYDAEEEDPAYHKRVLNILDK